jgi:hypothetical protein
LLSNILRAYSQNCNTALVLAAAPIRAHGLPGGDPAGVEAVRCRALADGAILIVKNPLARIVQYVVTFVYPDGRRIDRAATTTAATNGSARSYFTVKHYARGTTRTPRPACVTGVSVIYF